MGYCSWCMLVLFVHRKAPQPSRLVQQQRLTATSVAVVIQGMLATRTAVTAFFLCMFNEHLSPLVPTIYTAPRHGLLYLVYESMCESRQSLRRIARSLIDVHSTIEQTAEAYSTYRGHAAEPLGLSRKLRRDRAARRGASHAPAHRDGRRCRDTFCHWATALALE